VVLEFLDIPHKRVLMQEAEALYGQQRQQQQQMQQAQAAQMAAGAQ
jgi:hypothetical protein